MQVPQLLLDTLEDLPDSDFKTFNWYLTNNVLDGCKRIPKARLEKASRTDTVDEMRQGYGEEMAVNITVEILRKMNNNYAAEKLKEAYAERRAATSSTSSSAFAPPAAPAPPAAISAQNGSVIIAPIVNGGTSGSWKITINK
ncbi:caspase b-like isoform X2 [Thunnus albacares]|uniref:caspase b-like isoform X2 n=1 Tax=Thunnus albacares TaxID=8236 RepID=UPI001CF6F2DA|nr:caspase b-like isoform X2 [Thunnus albacares]XP_044203548.1 caspase b-like isoform X2 [Thunnus albacares]XP_044203549.1 caspase b-like isoform X2 [Thunnus albacares]